MSDTVPGLQLPTVREYIDQALVDGTSERMEVGVWYRVELTLAPGQPGVTKVERATRNAQQPVVAVPTGGPATTG